LLQGIDPEGVEHRVLVLPSARSRHLGEKSPMPQSGWRTGGFGQVVGAKITTSCYLKKYAPP